MTTRYWVETECKECGVVHTKPRVIGGVGANRQFCAVGGQRRELTDVEVAETLKPPYHHRITVPRPGRYAIIPLEET